MVEQRMDDGAFEREIVQRLGLMPNLFRPPPSAPEATRQLWQLAKCAYLDAPLPPLFKERLAVHLSRLAGSAYCLTRHFGFLIGLGWPAGDSTSRPETLDQARQLLSLPLTDAPHVAAALDRLEAVGTSRPIPEPRSETETDLFAAAAALFQPTAAAARARLAIRQAFGDTKFELLAGFLAYLRMAHFWAEAHPELPIDSDLHTLTQSDPELAAQLSCRQLDHHASPAPADSRVAGSGTSSHRLHRLLEIDSVGVLFFDHEEGTLIDANDAFLDMTGYSREEVRSRQLTWQSLTPPEWVESSTSQIENLKRTGRIGPYEKEYFRKDGERAWMMFAGRDIGDGTLVELAMNIDDRKRTEAALRDSEARFRQFGEASSDVLWIRDAGNMQWEYLSPAFETIYGVQLAAVLQGDHLTPWIELMLPEYRARAVDGLERARQGERDSFDFRIIRQTDGAVRWLRIRSFPMVDAAGRVQRIGGITQDITALVEAADHQRLLLAELQHRVRNLLAVIRSIIRRTGDSSESVEDFAGHLEGRIAALSRIQAVVTRDPLAGFDLTELIADELRAGAAREDRQYSLSGPALRIKPKAAESIGLAMHELATNALKFGALTMPRGFINIAWRLEERDAIRWLVIDWIETGLSGRVLGASRHGFGTVLLEQMLPYDVGARVVRRFEPSGLRCEIWLPADDIVKH
ncbi:putative histidine kinase with PAS/PAC motif [Bradyrhizobium sp. ORS 375]|uniref:sensor histidine kinase n=1 Tax=Bradyrhizobium sp. (strain ORS 375) TaxID=566679 RepID=UPI0002405860|nr:sensor histidine kinase [Bradyrhizobium sp. ORS 375]CCD94146.1 putative histidine kinase with PAS/PAC motif [Bradyrhizobium sp. ORS 375]